LKVRRLGCPISGRSIFSLRLALHRAHERPTRTRGAARAPKAALRCRPNYADPCRHRSAFARVSGNPFPNSPLRGRRRDAESVAPRREVPRAAGAEYIVQPRRLLEGEVGCDLLHAPFETAIVAARLWPDKAAKHGVASLAYVPAIYAGLFRNACKTRVTAPRGSPRQARA